MLSDFTALSVWQKIVRAFRNVESNSHTSFLLGLVKYIYIVATSCQNHSNAPSKWFFHASNNSHPQAVNNPITTSTPITCAVWSWPPGNVFVRVRATGVVCSVEEYRQLTLSTKSCDKVCVAVHGGSQATILTDWRTDSGTLCWPVIRDTVYWAWFPGFGGLWGPETRNGFLELHSLCLLVNWIEVNF